MLTCVAVKTARIILSKLNFAAKLFIRSHDLPISTLLLYSSCMHKSFLSLTTLNSIDEAELK